MNVPTPAIWGYSCFRFGGAEGGGGPSGIITLHPGSEEDVELIAHEATHTYWNFIPPGFEKAQPS